MYCSMRCKMKAWSDRIAANERSCGRCGILFAARTAITRYCPSCVGAAIGQRSRGQSRRTVPLISISCAICGMVFQRRSGSNQKTCGFVCRGKRLALQLKGHKYRPCRQYVRVCDTCNQPFIAKHIKRVTCLQCVKRISRRGRRHCRERCKRAGVPYVAGVTRDKVFARDRYRCQLCGCPTPKRLRGTYKPNAPELDHITPLAAGGGHTWDNVQCACRKCNGAKNRKPLGQLRLAV